MAQKSKDDKLKNGSPYPFDAPDKRTADLLLVYEDKTLILFGKPRKDSTIKKV